MDVQVKKNWNIYIYFWYYKPVVLNLFGKLPFLMNSKTKLLPKFCLKTLQIIEVTILVLFLVSIFGTESITAITLHSDKKSKNQMGNSAAMFIKPKNHKIDLILPWRCFLEFLAFYFFLNFKRLYCYEVEFENRALETQKNTTWVKLNQFWWYFV